jgi:hypothetical protein
VSTQAEAQKACNAQGAHLAAWPSQQTQNEVEAYFAANGYLLPDFHKVYWMGMVKREAGFVFLDANIKTAYRNWGIYSTGNAGEGYPEPNNYFGDELCAIANYTMSKQVPPVWGFADYQCTGRFIFMCKNAAPGAFNFTDPATSYNYLLNTNTFTFDEGEAYCQLRGSHLVTYRWGGQGMVWPQWPLLWGRPFCCRAEPHTNPMYRAHFCECLLQRAGRAGRGGELLCHQRHAAARLPHLLLDGSDGCP